MTPNLDFKVRPLLSYLTGDLEKVQKQASVSEWFLNGIFSQIKLLSVINGVEKRTKNLKALKFF